MYIKHLCDYGKVGGKILTDEYSEPRDNFLTDFNCELVSTFFKKYCCHMKDLYNQRNGC